MELLTRWSGLQSGGPGRPFVTYYDVATGERTELSGTTTANWVAKTANLLVDELDAEPTTRVQVALPTHWLRIVCVLATWAVGGTVVDAELSYRADVLCADGVIQAMEVLTPPVGRKFSETVRQIRAFQHVRATKGAEATPAGWEPGELTLKPGPDLVGKVWEVWQPAMER